MGGHVLLRGMVENTVPTYDNNFIDLLTKIPPELRFSYRIYHKFLKKISPELSRIPYNKTMIRADAPLTLWTMGTYYQSYKKIGKKLIARLTRDKIILSNKSSYVNFDEWFRTNETWKKFFKELLLAEDSISKKFLNQRFIKSLIDEHEEGELIIL